MATKDITNRQVMIAYQASTRERNEALREIKNLGKAVRELSQFRWPEEILNEETGEPIKVCFRAMERAEKRGLIEYGVSLRSGWLTDEGLKLLEQTDK